MAKKIVHINKSVIAQNVKDGGHRPTITVKHRGKATYCRRVKFLGGETELVQSETPLSCGARVWIETDGAIVLTDPMAYRTATSPKAVEKPTGKPKQKVID